MASQQPSQSFDNHFDSYSGARVSTAAISRASMTNALMLQHDLPPTAPPSYEEATSASFISSPGVNAFEDNPDTHSTHPPSPTTDRTTCWTPHLQVGAFAALSGGVITPENSLHLTTSRTIIVSNNEGILISHPSDDDGGWNGRNPSGFDLIDRGAAMEVTLRAGRAAQDRRCDNYPPPRRAQPTVQDEAEDTKGKDHVDENDAGRSTQKVKRMFKRLFRFGEH